jgi:hypothetical protein
MFTLDQSPIMYYHRDGKPILDNELLTAAEQWGIMFEDSAARIVGSTKTLYGERLSTVWLGMDHNWGWGKPLLFETMLFAPTKPLRFSREYGEWLLNDMREHFTRGSKRTMPEDLKLEFEERQKREAYNKKHFPDDQLQIRYTTENEARDKHEELTMQCLIPPRWRHFLLWTVGRQETWRRWDDEDDD